MTVESVENVSKTPDVPVIPEKTQDNTEIQGQAEAPKPSPAQDLRDIQNLLVSGIFPGNMAPSIVRAYQLLEAMAKKVENDQKDPA